MKKRLLLLFFIISFFSSLFAQEACSLRISLLTCSPGSELYSIFGHTAIRVTNQSTGDDLVYNYGTFEFGPDFYAKFIKGKPPYFLSAQSFADFIYNYQEESRSIVEQVLLINCAEKERLLSALQTNMLPQNRYYRYDFLFDNCTTRAKDIIKQHTDSPVVLSYILPKEIPSFRNLIHIYLNAGKQYWSKLGIDLLLGAKMDRKVSNEEAMFLPEMLLKGFDGARAGNQPLVTKPQPVLEMPRPDTGSSLLRPMIVFSFLLVLIGVSSFIPNKSVQSGIKFFDIAFFLLLGLSGILMLVMWFGTEHALCANNYNLLWALPTHTIAAFFVHSRKRWINNYLLATIIILACLLIGWVFWPQQLNIELLPLILLILLRSWLLILKPHHGTAHHQL